jgi:hypothetical protein
VGAGEALSTSCLIKARGQRDSRELKLHNERKREKWQQLSKLDPNENGENALQTSHRPTSQELISTPF